MVKALFVTGAGISAAAGIATYREGSSSWRDPQLEKKSHANHYGNHLDELWDKHWGPMSKKMLESEPTIAHKAIAKFQETNQAIIATQNIDILHERAGSESVAHVHGTMNVRCIKCKDKDVFAQWKGEGAPVCPNCGSKKTRPDVVLFGEMLDMKLFKALEQWSREVSHVIVIGSSLNVYPIAGLVMDTLSFPNTHTILINRGHAQFEKFFKEHHDTEADQVVEFILSEIDRLD